MRRTIGGYSYSQHAFNTRDRRLCAFPEMRKINKNNKMVLSFIRNNLWGVGTPF